MIGAMPEDIQPPLRIELLRFVQLRWRAGILICLVSFLYATITEWTREAAIAIAIGLAILIYNFIFWRILQRNTTSSRAQTQARIMTWLQIVLDLICLSALTTLTGGVVSPVIGFFVLHMVFSSLLLPHRLTYAAPTLAVTIEALALLLTGLWPAEHEAQLIAFGWASTLVLTVYLTNHIMRSIRKSDMVLQQSHRYINAVLRTAADGIITSDASGRIESSNPAAVQLFGFSPEEMLELNIDELLKTGKDSMSDADHTPLTLIPDALHGVRKDGSVFIAEEAHSDTELASGLLRISIIRDITNRLESELQVRQLNAELKKHQRHLIQHEKMIAIGQLAAGIAHEIANPLSNMDSLIQLARMKPDLMRKDTPQLLAEQVTRITRIVHQLKDFAHPGDSVWSSVSIDSVIENALKYVHLDRRHRDINIRFDPQPDASSCQVHAQQHLLEQVLVNILTNAIDAVAEIKDPLISIESSCVGQSHCVLTIQDNGAGIPEGNLDRVFEPFFTTKPIGYGTGLGLSISNQIIDRHGGSIEIQSEKNHGVTVKIILPIAERPSQPQEDSDRTIPDSKK